MSILVGSVVRFWDWQWKLHYKAKALLLCRSSSDKEGATDKASESSTEQQEKKQTSGAQSGASSNAGGPKPYNMRNMIGLIGGVVVLIIVLAMPASDSMFGVAGKMVLKKGSPTVLQAGVKANVLVLNKKGEISDIPNPAAFMAWAKQEDPKAFKETTKKAKGM